jgi:hypothetical protein
MDEAEMRFEQALSFNRTLGAVVWEAHTLADWAGLCLARADPARGQKLAGEAKAVAGRYGLAAVYRQLDGYGYSFG